MHEVMARDDPQQALKTSFGFRNNRWQLFLHVVSAILIGVSLRMTTFKDASIAASSASEKYSTQTAFLISFGFTKAFSNLAVGRFSDLYGRKHPHSVGWATGVILGVFLLGIARSQNGSWTWYVLANIFLGAQQGLTWTTNIFMFIDILGPNNRSLASGISNSVGYLSSAVTTYAAAVLSVEEAFAVVLATSILGLLISTLGVRDTTDFVTKEVLENRKLDNNEEEEGILCEDDQTEPSDDKTLVRKPATEYELVASSTASACHGAPLSFGSVLAHTCWFNKSTAIICLGGLSANLVTSLAWGLILIWAQEQELPKFRVANIGSAFTFSKALWMIIASIVSDYKQKRKPILIAGFLITIVGLLVTSLADTASTNKDLDQIYFKLLIGGMIVGCGIGSVYCVMAGAMSDHTPATNRASAIGVYKLWRDSGYAVGGLLTGILADAFGGSFIATTLVVAGLVGILVLLITLYYQDLTDLTLNDSGLDGRRQPKHKEQENDETSERNIL